jgi:antitoxin CptB
MSEDDLQVRRRRAAYRATHRGTKEMDITLGRFAAARLAAMPAARLDVFERLLALPDPQVREMVWHPEACAAGEFAELIAELRAFHGLEARGA